MTAIDDHERHVMQLHRALARRPSARNGPTFSAGTAGTVITYVEQVTPGQTPFDAVRQLASEHPDPMVRGIANRALLNRERAAAQLIVVASLWTDDDTCEGVWVASTR